MLSFWYCQSDIVFTVDPQRHCLTCDNYTASFTCINLNLRKYVTTCVVDSDTSGAPLVAIANIFANF